MEDTEFSADYNTLAESEMMRATYPDYVHRPFRIWRNGDCYGYIDRATYLKFRKPEGQVKDLEAIIVRLGVHPLLGSQGEGWWIEQNAHELATFLEAIQPVETVLELGTGYRAGLARFMTEVMGWEVTSIDNKTPQTPAPMARLIHATTHEAFPHVSGQQFDLVLIDADHTYDSVSYDYQLYAPLAKKVVALHDICGLRDCEGAAAFWRELAYTKTGKLRKGFHEAVADGEGERRAGIGWHDVASEVI